MKEIRLSKSAFDKCNKDALEMIEKMGIKYKISERSPGRPNIIESRLGQMVLKVNPLNYSKSYVKWMK